MPRSITTYKGVPLKRLLELDEDGWYVNRIAATMELRHCDEQAREVESSLWMQVLVENETFENKIRTVEQCETEYEKKLVHIIQTGVHRCARCRVVYAGEAVGLAEKVMCPSCFEAFNSQFSDYEHSYDFKPRELPFLLGDNEYTFEPGATRFVGVELEFESPNYGLRPLKQYRHNLIERFTDAGFDVAPVYFMHDGSLTNGTETATVPIEIGYALSGFPWEIVRDVTNEQHLRSYTTNTCGMHVHVSRNSIPNFTTTMVNVCMLHDKFYEQFVRLGRRTSRDGHEHWAGRLNMHFEQYWSEWEVRDELYSKATHYYCVNFLPDNTVEFRLPKGTNSPRTIRGTIDVINTIIELCSKWGYSEVEVMTWEKFKEQLFENVALATTKTWLATRI